MLGVLYRYIFKEIAVPFSLSVVVLAFVALMPEMVKIAEKVLAFGISGREVIEVISYLLPTVLLFVIPASFLLAVLVAFGRLSADSEMIALRAGGISLWQLTPPVIALGLIASLFTCGMSSWGEPWGRHSIKVFLNDLAQRKLAGLLRERTFTDDFLGKVVYADSVVSGQGILKNVFVADESDPSQSYSILASSGRVYADPVAGGVMIHLENGTVDHIGEDSGSAVSRLYFDKLDLSINADTGLHQLGTKDPYEMYPGELYAALKAKGKLATGREWMAFYKKFAYPLIALLIGLIGMSLGISDPRHGKSRGYAFGLVAMLVYYLLVRMGDATGEKGTLSPEVAAWTPDVVFASLGAWLLTARANEKETFLERIWAKISP